jgi:glutamine synthetase
MSLAFPNTVLNTIVAEAIDELADQLEAKLGAGTDLAEAVAEVVKDSWAANKTICFGGDNYDEVWHAEAEKRGLKNLRTTPDALPEVLSDSSVGAFGRYDVLSERELESRYEVWLEQYIVKANIEAETAHDIAKTMILPAALRHLARCAESGLAGAGGEAGTLTTELIAAIDELEQANSYPEGAEGLELAKFARDSQLAAMVKVREVADQLEKEVSDDLWPLPKYSEILFVR